MKKQRKRKSMVIVLNGIIKKISFGCLTIVFIAVSCMFEIPRFIAECLANEVFATDESDKSINDIFSLEGEAVLKSIISFELPEENLKVADADRNNSESILSEKTQKNTENPENERNAENSENAEEIPEIIPDSPAVDISADKPANAVVFDNIIVSNVPQKQFNVSELLNRPLEYKKTEGYKVLIIHTHTTEAYLPNDRSENQAENIVRVGEEFARVLNENGIKTLHCKTVHDAPYSQSYINELASIKKILEENPTIEAVIDVHRDGLYNSKNEKLRPVTQINGEAAAQVMLVCGTNASGLPHETWESCFSFALKIQNNMNKNYPKLARPVNLRTERFNTHMTKNSVIFEIGANGNTLQEAVNAAKYAAASIAEVIKNSQ